MSGDPTELLDRATPASVPDLDYHRLARVGRRRRRVRQWSLASVAVVAVAAGGMTLGVRPPVSLEVTGQATPQPGGESNAAEPSGEPVGTWKTVGELSAARNEAFVEATSDGQVVVFGGSQGIDGPGARDGLVLDPATGRTETIPAPPVANRPFPFVALAEGRLVLFGGNDGTPDGAVYDLQDETWTVVPAVPSGDVAPNVRYWDGTTLIVGGTYRISTTGLGNPSLWQWQLGQDDWTPLPDSPLDPGEMTAAAGDGKLAVWTDPPLGDNEYGIDGPGLTDDATDGQTRLAVYDLDAAEWTSIARDGLPRLAEDGRAHVSWQDGDLVVVPLPPVNPIRQGDDDRGQPVELAAPVAYIEGTWRPGTLEPLPADLRTDTLEVGVGYGEPVVTTTAQPVVAKVGHLATALLDDGTWTDPVSATRIDRVGDRLVALDSRWGHVDEPLAAAVWTDAGWQPATEAPGLMRGYAGVATTEDALYLVSGTTLRSPEPGEEPDARPSEDGEPGPYVIDPHGDILRYTPRTDPTPPTTPAD